MPCSDDGWSQANYEKDMQKRLDSVTRLLCSTLRLVDTAEKESKSFALVSTIREIPGLAVWWKQHKKDDAAREKRAQQQEIAELRRLEAEHNERAVRIQALRQKHPAKVVSPPASKKHSSVITSATDEKTKRYAAKAGKSLIAEEKPKRGRKPKMETVTTATKSAKTIKKGK